MARPKLEALHTDPAPEKSIGILRDEIMVDDMETYADQFEDALDDESDFDVDEDIAFLGEEYDVLELDDVLELCNLDKHDPYQG